MGKYQAYPEYKDSGVEWLGEIPSFWRCTRLKRYCKVTDGSHHSPKIEADGYPFISVTDVGLNSINFSDAKRISQKDYRRLVKEGCKPSIGDVLLTKDGTIGRACIVKEDMPDFVILSSLGLLTPKEDIVNSYLYYYLVSGINVDQMNSMIHGSALRRMTISKIDDLILVLPSRDEQTKIANFLDHETAKIDTLLEKQQQLIKLLKEKRQAVISHAVTKGLNPEVLMKDSGVEWLGEVPEHWEVKRLKNCLLAPMRNGLFKKKDQFGSGSLLVNVGDLYIPDNFISPSSLERVVTTKEEQQTYKVSSGDIFFVRSSLKLEGIGRSACFLEEKDDVVFECHIVNARPDKGQISPKYLTRYLNSELVSQEFIKRSKTTTMTTIDQGALSSITVLVPPLEEQLNVDAFLDKELGAIQIAVEKSELAIKLLTERRTAIISSAVTGKIDVRYWQAPTSQDQTLEHTA
ncbi:restriction endonuclease subunit S [Vibrio parahaemolyticus]|uniref:restriction endonuclease subunit S n=1 Tax=Vibrio parahaemolyticus TaxID=670 RepID=UPI0021609452|nr:restriction endonuclease subunit S [Vibrio parahaemolyticus]MCS0191206.1 restriction endonuclease subunit S [Vibrio parahaemolyticus]